MASTEQTSTTPKDTHHEWWQDDIEGELRPSTRKMLEEYAGVPSDKVIDHIRTIQKRAWDIAPYASVGRLTWLNPYILLHGAHDTIFERVKNGASILDCACMVAPDLRQLAYAGAPTDKMYGFDLEPAFLPLGYDLYNDKSKFEGHIFQANALTYDSTSPLAQLEGKIDVIWCAKYLHLYDRQHMIEAAAKLIKFLKPLPGSIFAGSQNGLPESRELPLPAGAAKLGLGATHRLCNAEDIKDIWLEAAKLTNTKWNIESTLLDLRTIGLHKDDGTETRKMTGYNLQWTATLL